MQHSFIPTTSFFNIFTAGRCPSSDLSVGLWFRGSGRASEISSHHTNSFFHARKLTWKLTCKVTWNVTWKLTWNVTWKLTWKLTSLFENVVSCVTWTCLFLRNKFVIR
jgi:hypothetical protein